MRSIVRTMPLRSEYVDFDSEIQSLQSDMNDLAEQASTLSDGDAPEQQVQQVIQQGNELNNQINILRALQDGDVEGLPAVDGVELAGLTAGEVNLVEDVVDKHSSVRHRDAWVAIGTRDGPYLEHDPSEGLTVGGVEDSVIAVADLPLPYVRWAEERISQLSHLSEGEGNGFLELVSEKQRNQG